MTGYVASDLYDRVQVPLLGSSGSAFCDYPSGYCSYQGWGVVSSFFLIVSVSCERGGGSRLMVTAVGTIIEPI